MTHALKTTLEYFNKISQAKKNFELRKMDRPFKNGDTLLLQEHDGEQYTGNELNLVVTDVFAGPDAEKFGLRRGFGIISFNEPDARKPAISSDNGSVPRGMNSLDDTSPIVLMPPPPNF